VDLKISTVEANRLEFSAMIFLGVEVGSDDNSVAELAAGEGLLRPLAICHRVELHKHLSTAGHLDALNGPWYFYTAHAAILITLLPDVLEDIFVFILVPQLLWGDHVEEAQHLGGGPRAPEGHVNAPTYYLPFLCNYVLLCLFFAPMLV